MSGPPTPGVLALRVIGLAGTLALVAAGAGSLVGGFFQQRSTSVRTLSAPVEEVFVDTSSGDVTVVAAPDGAAATVTTTRRWSVQEPTVSASTLDGRLVLRGRCGDGWDGFTACGVDYSVTVPAGTVVRVVSTTGDVRVEGVTAQVLARTTTGDVRAVRTGGPLDLRTTTGDVRVEAVRSTDVEAAATTGDVTVDVAVVPDLVRARTTTGDVTVQLPPGGTAYRVNASTPVGDPVVLVPQASTSTHLVDATTSLGDVRVTNR